MSYEIIREKVPGFTRRIGDNVIQGSNNTIMIFGTDRAAPHPAGIDDGLGRAEAQGKGIGTGAIHIIVGRTGEDPDLSSDLSYIYLSMKNKIDDNLSLGNIESPSNDLPAAVMKSDAIRMVYRKNLKICLTDGSNFIYMDGSVVKIKVKKNFLTLDGEKLYGEVGDSKVTVKSGDIDLQAGSAHIHATGGQIVVNCPIIKLGDDTAAHLTAYGDNLLRKYNIHAHPTAVGPSGAPLPPGLLDNGDLTSHVLVK